MPTVPPTPIPGALSAATEANLAFGLALGRKLSVQSPSDNLFFSPFSIQATLLMAAEGARNATADEMGSALQLPSSLRGNNPMLPWDFSPLRQALTKLANISQSNSAPQACTLNMASGLWADRSLGIDKSYSNLLTEHYHTGAIELADFRGMPDQERQRINQWVSQVTHGKIRDLVPSGAIDPVTRLVLANAIYFRGLWAEPFDPSPRPGNFTLTTQQQRTVMMMFHRFEGGVRYGAFHGDGSPFITPRSLPRGADESAGYPTGDGFQVLELPYGGGQLSLVIFLPNSATGLRAWMENCTSERVSSWISALHDRPCVVRMPRFRLETTIDLASPLRELGMIRAWQPDQADFQGISATSGPHDSLSLSAVLHKTYLEVNETGTEAAAATALVMRATSAVTREFTPQFVADHPFVFAIRDRLTGMWLFLGKLEHPEP